MRSLKHVAVSCKLESHLGFVACPDPTYGRFLSTDPLWAKYLPLQSYQYAGNEPLLHTDRSGFVVVFEGKEFGVDFLEDKFEDHS